MTDIALGMHVESLPDAEQQESTVAVVICNLRTGILQFAALENSNEEMLFIKTNVCIALFCIGRDKTFLLQGCTMFQLLSISTTNLHIGITLLYYAQNTLIETENHNSLERREYLVLHVRH